MARASRGPGFIATLQRMFATLLLVVKTRLELVSVEVEEQIAYAANLLVWTLVALFSASLGLLFLAITILIAFPERYRLLASGSVTAALIVLAGAAVVIVRKRLKARPRFLVASISELGIDAAAAAPDE
jgi:uncharacterized membrane protein YqjE